MDELHQEISSHSMESLLVCPKQGQERKPRPQPDQALKCPRCESTNTKFCYYNNYSLSQPRYFCKACRRYWTKGGTLRNVPVGGGCRKNKRSCPPPTKRMHDPSLAPPQNSINSIPQIGYDSVFRLQKQEQDFPMFTNTNAIVSPAFMDAIRAGYIDNQSIFNNYYCDNGVIGEVESGGTMIVPYEGHDTQSAMKHEACNVREEGDSRVLWGFPWQHMSGNVGGGGDFDSVRESWNGLNPTWHGLLNSALM